MTPSDLESVSTKESEEGEVLEDCLKKEPLALNQKAEWDLTG